MKAKNDDASLDKMRFRAVLKYLQGVRMSEDVARMLQNEIIKKIEEFVK